MNDLEARFPDILRRIAIDPAQVPQQTWLASVKGIAEELEMAAVVPWIRLGCRKRSVAIESLVLLFRTKDPTFPADNAAELHAVLACGVLEAAIAYADPVAEAIALGFQVARFSGWHPAVDNLAAAAPTAFQNQAIAIRSPRDGRGVLDEKDSTVLGEASTAAQQVGGVGPQLSAGFGVISNALDSVRIADLERRLRAVSEELNILWWLTSGALRDGTAVGSLDPVRAAGGIAIDLADMIEFSLPPPSARAVVAQALGTDRRRLVRASILDLIKSLSEAQRRRVSANATLGDDLTPIALAAAQSIEVDDINSWVPVVNSMTGGLLERTDTVEELSHELVLELKLLKLLGHQ